MLRYRSAGLRSSLRGVTVKWLGDGSKSASKPTATHSVAQKPGWQVSARVRSTPCRGHTAWRQCRRPREAVRQSTMESSRARRARPPVAGSRAPLGWRFGATHSRCARRTLDVLGARQVEKLERVAHASRRVQVGRHRVADHRDSMREPPMHACRRPVVDGHRPTLLVPRPPHKSNLMRDAIRGPQKPSEAIRSDSAKVPPDEGCNQIGLRTSRTSIKRSRASDS